jgi:hypothetical protein
MKIDILSIDQEQFKVDARELNGEVVYLIQPQTIGCKWNQQNKIFRSSLWNYEGSLISAGFPKFTNWGENPEHFPLPISLKDCVATEKIDGSLLILSKYKGQFIIRTRGTIDASQMDNGYELESFKQTILSKLNDGEETWNYSILFEWYSPNNRIVIRYADEPRWYLVGFVDHSDYSLAQQELLDTMAKRYDFLRPEIYSFDSIPDLLILVEKWDGKEGVCLYSNHDQSIHKIKAANYLIKHRLKEEFSSLEKVLEFYISEGCPDFKTFQTKIAEVVDWETSVEAIGDISRCVDAWKEVSLILVSMKTFIDETLKPIGDPKDKKLRGQMAKLVTDAYGNTSRNSFVFKLLDGKELGNGDLAKLFWQILKK